jgi:hypothetical protein
VRLVFCTTQWVKRYTTSQLDIKNRKAFQWGSGGWKAEACTPPGVLLRYFWGLCFKSRLINAIFVADLAACRLIFYECCGM